MMRAAYDNGTILRDIFLSDNMYFLEEASKRKRRDFAKENMQISDWHD
jgi:hypothetical protein